MSYRTALIAIVLGVAGLGAAQAHGTYSARPVVIYSSAHVVPVDHRPAYRPAPHRGVRVGEQLNRRELSRAVKVDWRRAGLRAPGRGQQWVRLDGRRLLVNMNNSRVLRMA